MPEIVLWAGPVLETAILIGLVVQRRLSRCHTLPALVLAWIASATIVGGWPDRNTWDFWISKELVHALLAFVVGLEVAWRALLVAPLAQLAAQRWIGCIAVLAVALVATAPAGPVSVTLLPRLLAALAWLYTGLALVMARYSIPIDRLHAAVLIGLSPYCILYWLTWSRTGEDTAVAGLLNPVTFLGVLSVLLWAAWQPESPAPAEPEIVKLVRPWTR